jgi:sugar phosphate isomerase/epimerase
VRRRSLLGLLPAWGLPRESVAQSSPAWRPGLQLFTIRDQLGANLDGALRRVADLGYREVELAGLPGATPAAVFSASLKRYGLGVPSMHAGYETLRGDLDAVVREAATFGASFVACPSIDAPQRRTADDWKRVCQTLSQTGHRLRDRGLTLAYHNHDYEFVPFAGGATPFDLLIRETDPADVKLEVDVYWVAGGGLDPLRFLADSGGRVALVHLKDRARDGATVELGTGMLPMAQIVRAALAAGARHLFVEQDTSSDPLRSIGISHRFLRRLPPDIRPGGV